MTPANSSDGRRAEEWLVRGRTLAAQATPEALASAVQAFDAAIDLFRAELSSGRGVHHELAVAWMNRGSALQKQGTAVALAGVVQAYDEAIALVRTLPFTTNSVFRNCLGTAWLNRGQALLQLGEHHFAGALDSHEQALVFLRDLPVGRIPVYRLNLAGAQINLANALLTGSEPAKLERARATAREALALVAAREATAAEFADLGLKARRVLCAALGQLLFAAGTDDATITPLADEASDAVDTGLALARHWASLGGPHFRPLATRLFRFGAQLYRLHQPQFLAEFLLENLDPAHAPEAFSPAVEFHAIAAETLGHARRELGRRPVAHLDAAATARLLEISRELAAAEQRLAGWREEFQSPAVSRS